MGRPLDGVKVIDFSNMLMAPYATQILGDQGADVIKVEAPGGDPVRNIGPARNPGMGAIFLNCNRSKRSIVLDVKKPGGLAALQRMIADADVMLYNRRPQSMQRLGLAYKDVAEINPRIIYVGLYGYKEGGPYAGQPAFDDLTQGAVGIPWLAHMVDGREPAYCPTAIADRGVALWAVGEINAALVHQVRTGRGQRIDIPMFEMLTSFVLGDHLGGETFDPPLGPAGYKRMLNPNRKPYPTKDGYVCVMVYTDRHWQSFAVALGEDCHFRDDPRYANMEARSANITEIYTELAALLLTRTTTWWMDLFNGADIPAMPLHTLETLIEDPQLAATGFFGEIDHPSEGKLRSIGVPSSWTETQPAPSRHAPRLGEHSAEVLGEYGYGDDEIAALMADGVTQAPAN